MGRMGLLLSARAGRPIFGEPHEPQCSKPTAARQRGHREEVVMKDYEPLDLASICKRRGRPLRRGGAHRTAELAGTALPGGRRRRALPRRLRSGAPDVQPEGPRRAFCPPRRLRPPAGRVLHPRRRPHRRHRGHLPLPPEGRRGGLGAAAGNASRSAPCPATAAAPSSPSPIRRTSCCRAGRAAGTSWAAGRRRRRRRTICTSPSTCGRTRTRSASWRRSRWNRGTGSSPWPPSPSGSPTSSPSAARGCATCASPSPIRRRRTGPSIWRSRSTAASPPIPIPCRGRRWRSSSPTARAGERRRARPAARRACRSRRHPRRR